MVDRSEQRGIHPPDARQHPRVDHVALVARGVDRAQLARIRDQDLVTERLEQRLHPQRKRPDLAHHSQAREATEVQSQRLLATGDLVLHPDRPVLEQTAHLAEAIAQVQAYGLDLRDDAILRHRPPSVDWDTKPATH